MSYSLSQYAEMHYYYGVAQGNGSEAARLYREALERRREVMQHYPDHRVFINTHNNLMAGRIPGRNQPHGAVPQDPDQVEGVLEEIQRDPSTSSRKITRRTGIPRTTVIRILKEATLLILQTCESYILLTANMEDVHALAQQLAASPVVDQVKKIWRRASVQFQKELAHNSRRHGGTDEEDHEGETETDRRTRRIIRDLVAIGKETGYLEPIKQVLQKINNK